MDCPQCGAEVPSDDVFCGKCGYARRDQAPERVDQSRIRVHEEPEELPARQPGQGSQQRIRKHTVMGMPAAPTGGPPAPPAAAAPTPPTEISTARSRARGRKPQKTMLGIPRPDFPAPPGGSVSEEPGTDPEHAVGAAESTATGSEPQATAHRARARVRYDSANEPFPIVQRRKRALVGLAVLVLLATGWLVYRYLTLNG